MILKRIIKKLISLIVVIIALANLINLWVDHYQHIQDYKSFYEKRHLTAEDLKVESSWNTCTTIGGTPPEEVRYKKLYGVEYIGKYEIAEDGGIEVKFLHGAPAKVLILDEDGDERFYAEVSELDFEPGETGGYDVYLVGNKFTGRVAISTY